MQWTRRSVTLVTLWFFVLGLFFFSYRYLEHASYGRWPAWQPIFIDQMTGALASYLLFWPLFLFTTRFPLGRGHTLRNSGFHLLAMLLWSFTHTTLLALSRPIVYAVWLQQDYDYGDMPVRYLMEFSIGVFSYSAQVGALSALLFQRMVRERELRAAHLERELTQAHLDALRLQLRPHFLFNALNAVSAVMYEDPRKADRMIASLSDFLRAVLHQSTTHTVPLHEEMRLLNHYLSIMQVRFGNNLRVECSVPDKLHHALVPPLLLQPLVENCVQHGVNPTTGLLHIAIAIHANNRKLHLTVRDHGPGLDANSAAPGSGIGLSNTRRRLERLYGQAQSLLLQNAPEGGAQVSVVIPLQLQESQETVELSHAHH